MRSSTNPKHALAQAGLAGRIRSVDPRRLSVRKQRAGQPGWPRRAKYSSPRYRPLGRPSTIHRSSRSRRRVGGRSIRRDAVGRVAGCLSGAAELGCVGIFAGGGVGRLNGCVCPAAAPSRGRCVGVFPVQRARGQRPGQPAADALFSRGWLGGAQLGLGVFSVDRG